MFTSDVIEREGSKVPVHGVEAATLESILDYMYSGELGISNQNVQNLFSASNFFEMLDLVEKCTDHMINAINTTNCLEVYFFGEFSSCNRLQEAAFSFILKKFVEISRTDEFKTKVSVELLEKFLESDGIYVGKEEEIFEYIVKWVEHDIDERKSAFCRLFKHLRITLIEDSYLEETIKPNHLVKSNPFCTSLLASAKIYKIQSSIGGVQNTGDDFTESFCLVNPKPRMGMYNRKLIVFSGGTESADDRSLTAFDPATRKNYCAVKPHPTYEYKYKLEHYSLVCVNDSVLYFLGGIFFDNYHFQSTGEALQDVYRYDQRDLKWSKIKQMICKRCALSACAYGEEIYVVGGKSSFPRGEALDSMEVYDSEYDYWSMLEPMPLSLYFHATCIFQDAMYVFGGKDALDECVDVVCRYSITEKFWSVVRTQMMKPRAEHLALTTNNKIFIIGGASKAGNVVEVEIYDPETNRWRYGPDFPEERKVLNAVVFDGNILVCGGVREMHRPNKPSRRIESKDLFEYDVMDKVWTKRVRMVQYCNLQACTVATLNTTFLEESDYVSVGDVLEEQQNKTK
ncbi:hypothetical protein FSP39_005379 [Pinctada imbricata]|uniref:BTB domain-containing protein n=1 Tax=Pinctada imbricata TaxID=66713 RepID=A0AA88YAS0_PINIB|nr:hypothetical protein FSP39_005379 [Pinctada imbricata]